MLADFAAVEMAATLSEALNVLNVRRGIDETKHCWTMGEGRNYERLDCNAVEGLQTIFRCSHCAGLLSGPWLGKVRVLS